MDPRAAEQAAAYRAERSFQESAWNAAAYNRDAIEREKQANQTLASRVAVLEEQMQRLMLREAPNHVVAEGVVTTGYCEHGEIPSWCKCEPS